jgi:hypothetical protein
MVLRLLPCNGFKGYYNVMILILLECNGSKGYYNVMILILLECNGSKGYYNVIALWLLQCNCSNVLECYNFLIQIINNDNYVIQFYITILLCFI